jgi:hypothetical protein
LRPSTAHILVFTSNKEYLPTKFWELDHTLW